MLKMLKTKGVKEAHAWLIPLPMKEEPLSSGDGETEHQDNILH